MKITMQVLLTVCLLFALTLNSGCLLSRRYVYLDYNEKTDEMRVLQVYARIQSGQESKTEENANYIAQLYQHRERIYHDMPAPFGTNHAMDLALFLNPEDDKIYAHFVGAGMDGDKPDHNPSAFNNDKLRQLIKTQPGYFFSNKQNPLNYYAVSTYKGDAFTARVNMNFVTMQKDMVQNQFAAGIAREGKIAPASMGDWVNQMILSANRQWGPKEKWQAQSTTAPSTEKVHSFWHCLEADSLKMIKKQRTEGKFALQRKGLTFMLDLPLTKADQEKALQELPRLFKAFQEIKTYQEKLNRPVTTNIETSFEQMLIWLMDFKVEPSDQGIRLLIDTTPGYKLFSMKPPVGPFSNINNSQMVPAQRDEWESSLQMLELMKQKKLEIKKDLTLKQIISDFYAAKLKTYTPTTQPAD